MEKIFSGFIIRDNKIIIKDHIRTPKPITGTKIGSITKDNPFSSPFVVFMDLYRFSLPFETNIYMEKGNEYEPIIINHINKKWKTNFSEYSSTPYYDFDIRTPLGKKFNGKIDGWDKEKKIILECKVTKFSNLQKWIKDGPPKYYLLQMMLYAKLANAKEMWLVGYFLYDEEYEIPTSEKLDSKRVHLWRYKITPKTIDWFKTKENIVDDFITNNLDERISPTFDLKKQCDRELIEYLTMKEEKENEL